MNTPFFAQYCSTAHMVIELFYLCGQDLDFIGSSFKDNQRYLKKDTVQVYLISKLELNPCHRRSGVDGPLNVMKTQTQNASLLCC